jgi:Tol biopolymer transport system component
MSNASGGNEIYLKSFPTGDGLWQVSTDGGAWPRWSHDGSEIIFRSGAGGTARMMSVSFQPDPVRLGTPAVLFEDSDAPNLYYLSGFPAYDTMPDPDVLLMLERVGHNQGPEASLVFVEDWWAAFGMEE